jgi:hypothetical protein
MKRLHHVSKKDKHVGSFPYEVAYPASMAGIQPQQYPPRAPIFSSTRMISPDHPAHRPFNTFQPQITDWRTYWNGWMAPITVIKPFDTSCTSGPMHIYPSGALQPYTEIKPLISTSSTK